MMKKNNNIKYSISELAMLSGIKPHTIRIWEQRYGLLKPSRTDTKIRYYTDEDLKQLMNVSLLNRNGVKISKIACLCKDGLKDKVNEIETTCCTNQIIVDQLTKCMIAFDEQAFEKLINSAILKHGFKIVMLEIIYPFLEKIGLLWVTGNINPAQEHFISNLIRQKIIVAIDGHVCHFTSKSKKVMMFLPQHELHELSLLFFAYHLKTQNHHLIYLGSNIPNADVQPVIDVYEPDYVFTVLTSALHLKTTSELFVNLAKKNTTIKFEIAGVQAFHLSKSNAKNIHCFKSLNEVMNFKAE
jgi:MerR family transcriptional regulator, light-induced transcriptional regulator